MPSSGMLRRVALVKTDVSKESSASIIMMTRIGELERLAVASNRRTPDNRDDTLVRNVGSNISRNRYHSKLCHCSEIVHIFVSKAEYVLYFREDSLESAIVLQIQ
jgi:hypothetical protein